MADYDSHSFDAEITGGGPWYSNLISNLVVPFLWRSGIVVAGVLTIIGGFLYAKQESLLYFPAMGSIPRHNKDNPRGYRSPAERQVAFESYMIPCPDGVHIHAWLLLAKDRQPEQQQQQQQQQQPRPTFVFFHGNAGNIGLRLPNAISMLQLLRVNVLLVEYRGYGDSDSVAPTEAGLKMDAVAALNYIHTDGEIQKYIDVNNVFVFGRSLGGSVALYLAAYAEQNALPVKGVVVENTFLSISDMADQVMPFISPFKWLLLRMNWDSLEAVRTIQRTPILYLAGAKDELVPHRHMLELFHNTKPKENRFIHVIPDGTHNETWLQGGPKYWDALSQFLKHIVGRGVQTQQCATEATASPAAAATTTTSADASAIPIMPTGILNMAKEAVSKTGNTAASSSTEDLAGSFKKTI